ncbi:penicillin acylase family protein [Ornithinimicrobium cerasi]|uniref:Penicillin amidase n=1 Tax=Ornithinimicrobium cerasi TaxID=2248773 RepID=A0A285VIU3_9MICO|nr:penicillin acylase family protein [Ornithinimicrobium cerasi]SOC54002.1 penicillin amidase [Ornithinimicrobium cerasi]
MSRPLWQRVAVPVVAILVVVVVAAAVLGVGLARRAFPQTSGEIAVPGLSGEVEVVRDALGVAHIYADTPEDLFRAQGFVAAQDRFFQMDLRRHIVSGRLSELVGEGGVEADRVIRTMGWRRVAEQELPLLSPDARSYLQAYSAGVNAYIERQGGPSSMGLEYVVLAQSAPGYQVEPWDAVDSLTWLKAMAWDLRGNYTDELARGRLVGSVPLTQLSTLYPDYPHDEHPPILGGDEWTAPDAEPGADGTSRGGTRGPVTMPPDGSAPDPADVARLGEPGPPAPPSGSLAENWLAGPGADEALAGVETALGSIPELLGRGEGIGSNSWVVSGEHTETGLPLLANDPHLRGTQPGVWLQAGLHCRQLSEQCPFDVTGFTFAGFPGVIIGHNTSIAWGMTNLDPDVTDFYLEDVRGDTVRRDGAYVPMEVRTETIQVAGGDDVEITVRETVHGPIMSDVVEALDDLGTNAPEGGVQTSNDYEVSLAWTALEPSPTAEAVFSLNAATGWEDFREGARQFAVPSQNLIYADTEGNIGYQAPGLIPVRRSATHGTPPGFYPAPGWDSAYDWTGWVDPNDLPWTLNPDDGMIVTANQAVVRGGRPFLTTEFDKGYRSTRILELLQSHLDEGPLTTATMQQIQLDDRNTFAERLIPYLLAVDLENDFYTEAQDLLASWDRSAPAEGEQSAAAAYYHAVYDRLLEMVFDDELPPGLGATGSSRSMLLLDELLGDADSPWWDDRRTPGVIESRDEVVRTAMVDARHDLTRRVAKDPERWVWGDLHQIRLEHQVLAGEDVPGLVSSIFNLPAQPVAGSTAMVNATSWDASLEDFDVTSSPSMRMVVDLADLDASTWVNQTGSSGHPFHPNWDDQQAAWIAGETYPWPSTREAVLEAGEQTLTLVPDGGAGR